MKQALLMLLFQLHRQSMQSNSKLKVRMEILAAATFVGTVNETGLKQTLLMLTEKFEIDQNYTRMALFDYDQNVTSRTSLTDSHDEIVRTINGIRNRNEDRRSVLRKALLAMLDIAQVKGRRNALKVFLVITHRCPTTDEGNRYEYKDALTVSKEVNTHGLFFIVYNYELLPDAKVAAYFTELCGKENLVPVKSFRGVIDALEDRVIPKILNRACEPRERVCYFVDTSLQICQGFWYYPTGYLSDEECRTVQTDKNPEDCNVAECHEHCDQYWPWQPETAVCDCNVGNTRYGDLRLADLHNCPKVKECEGCGSATASNVQVVSVGTMSDLSQLGAPDSGFRLEAWTIVAVVAGGFAALGVLVFVLATLTKPASSSRNSSYRRTSRGRTRVKKRKPPRYRLFRSQKVSKKRRSTRKKRCQFR